MLSVVISVAGMANALPATVISRLPENIDREFSTAHSDPSLPSWQLPPSLLNSKKESVQVLSNEQLLAQPELLTKLMWQALKNEHIVAIEKLLPLYEQLPHTQQTAIWYAKGLLARAKKEYGTASLYFSKVSEHNKEADKAFVYWLDALLKNREFYQADKVLKEFASEPTTENLRAFSERIDQFIQKEKGWQGNISLSYINDKNINNAPDKSEQQGFHFEKPIADQGVLYQAELRKRMFFNHGIYAQITKSTVGKHYRQHQQFNDMYMRASLTLGYQNYTHQLSVEPYIAKRLFGDKPYTYHLGFALRYQHNWHDKLKVWSIFSFSSESYDNRTLHAHLDNFYQEWGAGIQYQLLPSLSLSNLFSLGKKYASDPMYEYHQFKHRINLNYQYDTWVGIDINFSQEWKRFFRPAYWNLSHGKNRRDRETQWNISLYKPNWQVLGIRPKLNINYHRLQSNTIYLPYHKTNIGLSFERLFK